MKKFLAVVLAVVFVSFSVVPAFAVYILDSTYLDDFPDHAFHLAQKVDDVYELYFSFDDMSGDSLTYMQSFYEKYSSAISDPNKDVFYMVGPSSIMIVIGQSLRLSSSSDRRTAYVNSSDVSGFRFSFAYSRIDDSNHTGRIKISNVSLATGIGPRASTAASTFYTSSLGSSLIFVPNGFSGSLSFLYTLDDFSKLTIIEDSGKFPTEHSLTINYLYSENNPAADSIIQEIAPGAEYSISSPEVEGYSPNIPVVTGTMPDEDLTVNVYYSKSFYPLTVKYQYQDGSQAAEDVIFQYPSGFVYDVPSPAIAGYRPDKQTVTGTMPGSALEEVVTYTPVQYDLTIYYRYADGSQAASTHQEQLQAGSSYSVTSPAITGYQPDHAVISGSMPAKDTSFTVIYTPDSGGGGVDPGGDGEDPGGGGEDPGGSGSGGDDPFDIPSQPPFSGYDPFVIPGLPEWSGYDPFRIRSLPPYSYNPFVIPQQ